MNSRGAALVTGGTRRIGRALVRACAGLGFDVAIHCRRADDDAHAAVAEVQGLGRRAILLTADLSHEAETGPMVGLAQAGLGPVTLLVNSASVFEDETFSDMNRASWDLHMETNLRAPLVLAQAFVRHLPADRHGMILNLLDQRVMNPNPAFFSYALSKSALWDATRMLAKELAPRIRVNAVGPGPVLRSIHQTEQDFDDEAAATLLKRAASPEEIAQAMAYLIDAPSVTGQMIIVDAGQHLT